MEFPTRAYAVTSFSNEGYVKYGSAFIQSFKANWNIPLLIYHEGLLNEGTNLLETEPCKSFLKRHEGNPVICGKKPDRLWRKLGQYNFRYDAWKFSRKIFAIAHASRVVKDKKLFWVDADVMTNARVPTELLHRLLPDETGICYLSRPGYHSECGFVGYNLAHEKVGNLIDEFEAVYAEDRFIHMGEWHDSWIFDRMIEQFQPVTYEIPHTDRGQPMDNSILGEYMTHYKGSRKRFIGETA